jgi:hypothetical protein
MLIFWTVWYVSTKCDSTMFGSTATDVTVSGSCNRDAGSPHRFHLALNSLTSLKVNTYHGLALHSASPFTVLLTFWNPLKRSSIFSKHTMKTWGSGGIASPFLTSALSGDEWSVLRLCRFTPGLGVSCTHWIGAWVGPRAGLDAVRREKSCSCQESNTGRPPQ